mmetsp:Transcript_26332/g.70274  ORF Transcript_26332/g.70274 Transcript_26332/m.70274 type:complete len:210 (+) Transcript_26332:380-1009(+)
MRAPPLKRLMVLKFGLALSRLSRQDTTSPLYSFFETLTCDALPLKWPSESKLALVSEESRSREEPAAEKPIFSRLWGYCPLGSAAEYFAVDEDSTIFTSNIYRPDLTPTLARAPARRYWKPLSRTAIRRSPTVEVMTLTVVSGLKNSIPPTLFPFSGFASFSCSFGGSATSFFSVISTSFASSPSVFCFFSKGAAMAIKRRTYSLGPSS